MRRYWFWRWFFGTRVGQRVGMWAERDVFPTTEAGWSRWIWRWRLYFWALSLGMVVMGVRLFAVPHLWFGVSRGSFLWWYWLMLVSIGASLTAVLGWSYAPDYRRRCEALRAMGWGHQEEGDKRAPL